MLLKTQQHDRVQYLLILLIFHLFNATFHGGLNTTLVTFKSLITFEGEYCCGAHPGDVWLVQLNTSTNAECA